MVEEMRRILHEIEQLLCEADNSNDRQCNDMAQQHLMIAREWQKRKVKKPPDFENVASTVSTENRSR